MKKYHISWFEHEGELVSTGETFQAKNEFLALQMFRMKHPNVIFLSMHSQYLIELKSAANSNH